MTELRLCERFSEENIIRQVMFVDISADIFSIASILL